jgi:hypothetical protein
MELDVKSLIVDAIKEISSISQVENTKKDNQEKRKIKKHIEIKSLFKDGDSVELSNEFDASPIVYKNIKKSSWEIKSENISEWTNRDFSIYMYKQYRDRYGIGWDFNHYSVITYPDGVKEEIRQTLGFCDNIVFKDYIDYFFMKWLDIYKIQKGVKFWLRSLKNSDPINDFCSKYDYNRSIKNREQVSVNKEVIENKDIETYYLLGIESLILKFGIINAINYLIINKNISKEKALDKMAFYLVKLYNNKQIDKVIEITNKSGPYVDKCVFRDYKEIFLAIKEKGFNFLGETK